MYTLRGPNYATDRQILNVMIFTDIYLKQRFLNCDQKFRETHARM